MSLRALRVVPWCSFGRIKASEADAGIHPLSGARGFDNGIADPLRLQRVAEIGLRGLAALDARDEIGESIEERVLVADGRTRAPNSDSCMGCSELVV